MKKTTEQKFVKMVGPYRIVAICKLDDDGNFESIIGYAVLPPSGELILCSGGYCTMEKAIERAEELVRKNQREIGE